MRFSKTSPTTLLGLLVSLTFAGCGQGSYSVEPPATQSVSLATRPLTAEIWKQSQDQEKYAPEVLSRLRAEDPKLKSPVNWKSFYKEVVLPGFQRDVAGGGKPTPAPPSE